jgi:hypothetical protein
MAGVAEEPNGRSQRFKLPSNLEIRKYKQLAEKLKTREVQLICRTEI